MAEFEAGEDKLNPEWATQMETAILMVIEMAEIQLQPDVPIGFSPIQVSDGFDDRDWSELNRAEQTHILDVVFEQLDFDAESNPTPERSYTATSSVATYPEKQPSQTGLLTVDVFPTNRSEDGVYLHRISNTDPHSEDEFIIATKDFEISF